MLFRSFTTGCRGLDDLDELALMIRLVPREFDPGGIRPLPYRPFDIAEGRRAVDLRLPSPQEIEVRAVDDGDVH